MSAQTWIPVEEALPDDMTTVMVHCPVSNEPVWMGYYDTENAVWHYVEGSVCHGVAHWAEMLEPPAIPKGVAS